MNAGLCVSYLLTKRKEYREISPFICNTTLQSIYFNLSVLDLTVPLLTEVYVV